MAATVSITESNVLTALRTFLMAVLPSTVSVVRGQTNRAAEPTGADYVVMIPIMRERLETNISAWSDGYLQNPQVAGTRTDMQPIKLTVQVDVHGPNAADNTQIVTTLFRGEVATTSFAASGFDVMPLYTSEPRQTPFLNAERQYEEKWSVDVVIQANPIVTTTQDFAATLKVGLIEVDATYPG